MSNSLNPVSGIYKIENCVNGKVYIGQSEDVERRIKDHRRKLRDHKHYNQHLQRAVDKYGLENFKFDLLEECAVDDLNEKEINYIAQYRAYEDGYNSTVGGDGNRGYTASEETRQKLRAAHADVSGKNNPMYGKKLVDIMGEEKYMAYVKRSREAKAAIGRRRVGCHLSEDTKQKISIAKKKYYAERPHIKRPPMSDATKMKLSETLRAKHREHPELYRTKHIVLINTGERFDSIEGAAKILGVDSSAISMCCSGKKLSAGHNDSGERYVWASEDDYNKMSPEERTAKIERANSANKGKSKPNARSVRCINTGRIFDTVTTAGNEMHIDISGISKCCRGKLKFAGKDPVTGNPYLWEFVE